MISDYTIVKGLECKSCGRPVVVIVEQYNPGEAPHISFRCADKCYGFMYQEVYLQTARMKEKK